MTPSGSRIHMWGRYSLLLSAMAIAAATRAVASPLCTGPFIQHAAGESPSAVAVADMNGDGRPDLVVAHQNDNPGTVAILLASPGGGFAPLHEYAVADYPISVA